MTSIVFIGMDVHTTNFTLCAYSMNTQECFAETQINPDVKEFDKYLKALDAGMGGDTHFVCGYEAGCLGYSIYHDITKLGYECKIIAPTTMAKSIDQKQRKNDRRDAKMIAKCLAYGTCSFVYVPTAKDDSVKEYIRMRDDIKASLKQIKQRIIAFCSRHGKLYERGYWTQMHVDWLRNIKFEEPILLETLEEYLLEYERLTEKIEMLDRRIEDIALEDEYREKVMKLRCFKGIETHTALSLVCEVGDFNRFPTADHFASFLGLTPSEHSSGNSTKIGGITKAGNNHLRMLLTESSQCFARSTVTKTKALKKKQEGNIEAVIKYADRANDRLRKKRAKMAFTSHNGNVIKTAIARELACFIWGMMTGNIA